MSQNTLHRDPLPTPPGRSLEMTALGDEAYTALCTSVGAGIEKLQSRNGAIVIDREGPDTIRVAVEEQGAPLSSVTVRGEESYAALCRMLDVITPRFAEPKCTEAIQEFWTEGRCARMIYPLRFTHPL